MSNKAKKSILIDADVYAVAKSLALLDRRTLKAYLEKLILKEEKKAKKL